MRSLILLVFSFSILFASSCQRKPVVVKRAFYYWQSGRWYPENTEIEGWRTLRTRKLYLKMFEVDRHPVLGSVPVAKTDLNIWQFWSVARKDSLELVPTIFVNNEVLTRLSDSGIDTLADNIHFLTLKYLDKVNQGNWRVDEMQIDCDWTAGNKQTYFKLLGAIKNKWRKKLSCTLRLYPYKYREKMGIPPVDRVMLMCYNLLNPFSNPDKNTIVDIEELKGYLGRKSDYPLPMDVALPVYSRMQHYQNGRFANVVQEDPDKILPLLKQKSRLWYEVAKDTVFGNVYLRRGDAMKFETVSEDQLLKTCELLKQKLPLSDTTTISLFHLHDYAIKHYPNEALEAAFDAFAD